ncbi:hypothetical protein CC78DRAFT_591255 [Lojkania enalia]|uniref:Uncharacterized protein n=1 Tax=Lojkania enalia TaxID=147567 RepID=A0A9P4N924_9PLEO|nr:hypothetical protein CC78DRAFT_591255 [Didymosphaeria enalia]
MQVAAGMVVVRNSSGSSEGEGEGESWSGWSCSGIRKQAMGRVRAALSFKNNNGQMVECCAVDLDPTARATVPPDIALLGAFQSRRLRGSQPNSNARVSAEMKRQRRSANGVDVAGTAEIFIAADWHAAGFGEHQVSPLVIRAPLSRNSG